MLYVTSKFILFFFFLGEWKKKLESFADWFSQQDSIVVNERLRLSKKGSSQSTDIFGYEGAFRKLAID